MMPSSPLLYLLQTPEYPRLVPYGAAHLAVLFLTLAVPLLLRWWVLARPAAAPFPSVEERLTRLRPAARVLGALLLICLPAKLIYTLTHYPRPWAEILPLQLCDLAAILIIIALFSYRQGFFEVAYYWGLAGTAQALFTPDLAYGFPHPYFFFFFFSHAAIVAGALTLILAGGMRPTVRGGIYAFLALLGYAATVFCINAALGVNYGYLQGKPRNPSLMDALLPWPYYIAQIAMLAAFLFLLLYLPHAPFWRRSKEAAKG